MSTPREREAALRRALLSAADQIEPAPGGLERIQARLRRPRPAAVAWLEAAWTVVVMRAPDIFQAVRQRSANVLELVWDRFGPRSATGTGPHRLSWLRPLAAMSVAVFVLGAGIYVAFQSISPVIPPGIATGALGAAGSQTVRPGQSGQGTTYGHGTQPPYSSRPSSHGGSPTCRPSAAPYKSGNVSTGPTFQPPSPTPTSSQSTSPTTSPSPTVSASSNPGASTPPANGGSVVSPDTGLASGNPAAAGGDATRTGTGASTTHSTRHSANSTQSASPAATGSKVPSSNSQQLNPCQSQKSKSKHNKSASTTQVTSTQLAGTKRAQTQPGRTAAARLD